MSFGGSGAGGAARSGIRFGDVTAPPGGLGAGLWGIILTPTDHGVDVRCGIGGGARGFSKLASWFDGNRGLAGGLRSGLMGPM